MKIQDRTIIDTLRTLDKHANQYNIVFMAKKSVLGEKIW